MAERVEAEHGFVRLKVNGQLGPLMTPQTADIVEDIARCEAAARDRRLYGASYEMPDGTRIDPSRVRPVYGDDDA